MAKEPPALHRRSLLALLDGYADRFSDEKPCVDRVRRLVEAHADCFERTCLPGHITASTWILSPDRRRFLLTHHRKLDRWLQLGGHADGDPDVARTALREAREESGLTDFEWGLVDGELRPFDLDVHAIPARMDEPAHEHHDMRFLLVAGAGQEIQRSDESHDLKWFDLERLDEVAREESLNRLGRKARALLPGLATRPAEKE